MTAKTWESNPAVQRFREYLRIPTVHPDIDYKPCVSFLRKQAEELQLPINVYYPARADKPVVVITWQGTDPDQPSIVLNSHMDVVPVFADKWTHPPFAAEMDADGKIFARGSQDMKCVGMQYLEAIRHLKSSGTFMKRTLHVIFVPDEEIGGKLGMDDFVKSEEFKKLNVGFALDEGIASATKTYMVYYAERSIWQVHFHIAGTAGHGSLLLENTAGVKLNYILNKMMDFRNEEVQKLREHKNLTIGDVTTVNVTRLSGGVQSNVIPPLMSITFDIRVPITVDQTALEQQLADWCEEAGGDIQMEFEQKQLRVEPTKIDDSNPFWTAFEKHARKIGLAIDVRVFPGGTDSRFIRSMGIPAIGFSPMIETPVLLHDHDEFLEAKVYLKGIEIYKSLIPSVANV